MINRDTVTALRQLREAGYIRGFIASDNHAMINWHGLSLRLDDEGVERLTTSTRLWALIERHMLRDEMEDYAGR